eukprot:3017348-Amphidinium_carterae.1
MDSDAALGFLWRFLLEVVRKEKDIFNDLVLVLFLNYLTAVLSIGLSNRQLLGEIPDHLCQFNAKAHTHDTKCRVRQAHVLNITTKISKTLYKSEISVTFAELATHLLLASPRLLSS